MMEIYIEITNTAHEKRPFKKVSVRPTANVDLCIPGLDGKPQIAMLLTMKATEYSLIPI